MIAALNRLRRRKAVLLAGASFITLAMVSVAYAAFSGSRQSIPTADVRKGDFVDYVQIRGELKALKSVTLNAPSSSGPLQIIKLTRNGSFVKKGEPVVVFDPTQLQNTLEQKRSELKQAEAEIQNTRAQARMTEEQDLTDLAKARYDVERAKLEVGKQEILSAIDAAKSKLALADSEQKLKEVEQKLKSDRQAAAAEIASKERKRDKALFDVREAETGLAKLVLRAPADGMIALMSTFRGGGNLSEFRQGDRAWPGAAIAALPDLNGIRVSSQIDETERGRLKVGQAVSVRVDAVPDKEFTGSIAQISPLTKADFTTWPVQRKFDVEVELKQTDSRLRPGMSATARIAVDRLAGSVIIPSEAVFEKAGRAVVYVVQGSKFRERPIEIARRANAEVAVARGLSPGEKVATRDPNLEEAEP